MAAQVRDTIGMPMEGLIARWYAKNAVRGREAEFEKAAQAVTGDLPAGSAILEVAPGPGYLAIKLARLGRYRVSGLEISRTFVEIERQNAAAAGVQVDFQLGSALRMPFGDNGFDRLVCQAAFKNFGDPVVALDEMHRVLKPGGQAVIFDLRADATDEENNRAVDDMGLSWFNALFTKLTFKFVLKKRAYTRADFDALAARSHFKTCVIQNDGIGMGVWLKK
jgi:ubiquinone/menaquinone biosynthesis C-methylase UbiE